MSETMRKQYRGMVDRGTCTLATIDAAEAKRFLTAAEATDVRGYWHAVYDVVGLFVDVAEDRSQVLSWDAPTVGIGQVYVTRTGSGDDVTLNVAPTADPVSFPAPLDGAEAAVTFSAVVTAANAYQGPVSTTTATVPAAPTPEPTPEPTPTPDAPADGTA